jgi:hypothetical protein
MLAPESGHRDKNEREIPVAMKEAATQIGFS